MDNLWLLNFLPKQLVIIGIFIWYKANIISSTSIEQKHQKLLTLL